MEENFKNVYDKQTVFQQMLIDKGLYGDDVKKIVLPYDSPKIAANQILHLLSEMGEVLAADKRWKEYRKNKYDENEKKEEIADCLIFLLNLAIYSNMSSDELLSITSQKIDKNFERVKLES